MASSNADRNRWMVVVVLALVALGATWLVGAGRSARPAAAAPIAANDVVTVSGTGVVQGVPDTLDATFDVHVVRSSVQAALDAEAASVRRVLNALAGTGITGRAVQTTSLQLSPHYDEHGHVSGYDATETVTAMISPLRNAGRAISTAASASGNDVSVDGLTFDIADDQALSAQARSKAFADAHDRAQQYAGLARRSLGAVVTISERVTTEQPVPRPYADALTYAGSAARSVAIRPGEQPVTVTVTVTWRMR